MKPAEHYRIAEQYLKDSENYAVRYGPEDATVITAARHAQLHLLAAQVGLAATVDYSMDLRDDWEAAFAGYRLGESEVTS